MGTILTGCLQRDSQSAIYINVIFDTVKPLNQESTTF